MASADERPWVVDKAAHVHGLHVILLKLAYVLPWSQFLYAEGTSEEVQAVFSTHDIVVSGSGLDSLLADFASQQVAVLKEPARTDKFSSLAGPSITRLEVRRVDESNRQ